jgi:predicted metal-binding membrane protein
MQFTFTLVAMIAATTRRQGSTVSHLTVFVAGMMTDSRAYVLRMVLKSVLVCGKQVVGEVKVVGKYG